MLAAAVVFLAGEPGRTQAQDVSTQDYTRITQVPRAEVDAWLKQEIAASGGNWNADRYHFYIGFSTGHFGQDPVHAIAMRRLAFSLVNNSLAVGDRVTPIAWEMATWNVGPSVTLTDAPASRAEFVNRVPYAPHAGSQGGHDIERVLYETITKTIPADESQSAIILLLTNSNQSQSPRNVGLFGADNPLLAQAVQQGNFRLPLVRKEFRLQAGTQAVTVAVTALFPSSLKSLPGAPAAPRYPTFARETWQPPTDRPAPAETLPNPIRAESARRPGNAGEQAQKPSGSGVPVWVWGLVALAAVAAVAFFLRPRPRKPVSSDQAKAAKPTLPQAASIPGSLTLTIGPDEQKLESLTTANRWILRHDDKGKIVLADETGKTVSPDAATRGGASQPEKNADATAAPIRPPLAKLTFDANRALRVEAENGVQFVEQQLTTASSSNHLLVIEPGKKVLCRILPPDTEAKTRLEIAYEGQKGSRV